MIDSVDEQLVRLLGQDARQNSEALAKQLKLSAATVRRRLRKLMRSGLLRIVGVVDPASFGFPVLALITLDVVPDKVKSAIEELAKHLEVRFTSTTTGRYDVIAIARFRSTDHLSEFLMTELAKLEGLRNNETFICLQTKQMTRPLTGL